MAGRRINISLLTSSRADFSIYLPLLNEFKKQKKFNVRVIAFGTHLSKKHGYTVQEIHSNSIKVAKIVPFVLEGDKPYDIAINISAVVSQFAALWGGAFSNTDLIICLGDRYEMYAAVLASVPFQIKVAHIHGGENTLGAIDNIFRNSLTQIANLHFVSADRHAKRVEQLVPDSRHVYNVGALGIESMKSIKKLTSADFYKKFKIRLKEPVLATLHPETAGSGSNKLLAISFCEAMLEISKDHQVVITMPNADTEGNVLRRFILQKLSNKQGIHLIESLGAQGYYTALVQCKMIIGNSSSGIIEAASFGKWVVNIGNRQEGRTRSGNVMECKAQASEIIQAYRKILNRKPFSGKNSYGDGHSAKRIISILTKVWSSL